MTASPMMTAYREWLAAKTVCNGRMSDDERDELVNSMLDPATDKVMEAPVMSGVDLLMRLRVELDWAFQPVAEYEELNALIADEIDKVTAAENNACPSASAIHGRQGMIEDLIRAHINAKAEHDRLFALNDQGLESNKAVSDVLGPIGDALIALCRARPIDPFERDRRRQYLSATLYNEIDGCEGLTRAVLEALVEDGEAS